MQFNYIYLTNIQGDDKLSISRTLKDCTDLEIFEQEAIQDIIDYKWDTYTRSFFLNKFLLYSIFIVFFYIDIECALIIQDADGNRVKDFLFYFCKGINSII